MSQKVVFTYAQAKEVGEALGVTWEDFDVEQFLLGMDFELEHGTVDPVTNMTDDDPLLTGKITLAHLKQIPDFYSRLQEMRAK